MNNNYNYTWINMPAIKLTEPMPKRLNSKGKPFIKGDPYEPTGNKEHDELRQGRVFDEYNQYHQFCYQKRSDRTGKEYFSGKKAPWCRERWFTRDVFIRSQIATAYDRKVNDAKKRKIELSITKEDFINYVEQGKNYGCRICGEKLRTPDILARHFYTNDEEILQDNKGFSLDRVNNDEGYHTTNIQVACKECNTKKGSGTLDFFTDKALEEELISRRLKEKNGETRN